MTDAAEMPADADGGVVDGPAVTIRIVIADDHAIVRRGLRMLLDGEPDFEVVAEADNAEAARRYVHGHHPHVLVLDINMPGGSSLDTVPTIRAESSETQIVVLTMQDEAAYARQAMRAGVLGYVLKEAADEELVEAVRRAAAGQSYLNPKLGARVAAEPPPGPPDGLSEREVEVLQMIALGHTNAEVAAKLYVSYAPSRLIAPISSRSFCSFPARNSCATRLIAGSCRPRPR